VTNRPLDRPAIRSRAGSRRHERLRACRGVDAARRLFDGDARGTFLPNGELDFTGGVSLPPTVNLFERKSFDRELFRPPSLDIPIFGVSALGQRIGIFATIGGSLTFTAE